MGDEKVFKEISEQQLLLNEVFGEREYDEISYENIFELIKKIGYAMYGNPKHLPKSKNYYTGYSNNEIIKIQTITDKIIEKSDSDPICFACTFLSVYFNNEISLVPLFRIVKKNENVFIDISGRVYNNWTNFVDENDLSKCTYYAPSNGKYISTGVEICKFSPPACNMLNKAVGCIDYLASGACVGAAVGTAVVSAPISVPILGVASSYCAVRAGVNLYDRKTHEQSISLKDREARSLWINIFSSATGLGNGIALFKAKKFVDSGLQLTKFAKIGIGVLNGSSVVFSGCGIVNSFFLCKNKYLEGTLTSQDVFNLSCELLFFYNAFHSVKVTRDLINQLPPNNPSLIKKTFSNIKKKISWQEAKVDKAANVEKSTSMISSPFLFFGGLSGAILPTGYDILKEGLKYYYDRMGYHIECWCDKKINKDTLMKYLWNFEWYKLIMDEVVDMIKTIQDWKCKVKQYFNSASEKMMVKLLESIKSLNNKLERIQRLFNDNLRKLKISTNENNAMNNEQERNDETPISIDQEVFKKIDEMIESSNGTGIFSCETLDDYTDFVDSVSYCFIDEYSEKLTSYTNALNAAIATGLNIDRDLEIFNKNYGIEGKPERFFLKQTIDKLDSKNRIFKIKNILKKYLEERQENRNFEEVQENMFYFSFEKTLKNEHILYMIKEKMKLNDFEKESVELNEEEEKTLIFITPKNESKEFKVIVVHIIYKDNQTSGMFHVYK